RCWGPISVALINRPTGQAICHNDCYRLTYYLSDFHATLQDDEGPARECDLLHDNFAFRPPGTTLQSHLTGGRYTQVLQCNETYEQLTSEMVPGGAVHLVARYNLSDPLISQLVSSIANEIEGGFLDQLLADALNTALAVQIMRVCSDQPAITLDP